MKKLCEKLGEKFDHIIIDTPAAVSDGWTTAVAPANFAVIFERHRNISL